MSDNNYDKLLRDYRELKKEHEILLSSGSWKVTRPLRLLLRQAMRAKAIAGRMAKYIRRRFAYWTSPAPRVPHSFALYRIIGNDLYPRHAKGQQYSNLKFILENEPDLKDCTKIFVVNRILDKAEESKVIELLEEYGCEYIHIPFIEEDYGKIGLSVDWIPERWLYSEEYLAMSEENKSHVITSVYRYKNNYIMNNNGARNVALRDGRLRKVRWVLPWDGNCFVTEEAWSDIYKHTRRGKYLKFFIVPMAREKDNNDLLKDGYIPKADSEPQVIFRRDSKAEFNEDFCYGRRPKVELFWYLGIKGDMWNKSKDYLWDVPRRPLSDEAGEYGVAGWVSRLYSGNSSQEGEDRRSFQSRGMARNEAIISTIGYVDRLLGIVPESDSLMYYSESVLEDEAARFKKGYVGKLNTVVRQLESDAQEALSRNPYSVVDKTSLSPGGDINDYWHPSPYAWPNPDTPDGIPYIVRDGQRAPGTQLYDPESDKYDRTRIQRVFDDSIVLALAYEFTGNDKYIEHAIKILDRFFINKETRMNPNLKYAQVWMGRNNNEGTGRGIIEIKDIVFYLDAVRIMQKSGLMKRRQIVELKKWLDNLLDWLTHDHQGVGVALPSANNHGTFYDTIVASIADYLSRDDVVKESLLRARSRVGQQFTSNGSQPEELKRTLSQHYCYFNMQAWIALSIIGHRHGVDIWRHKASNGATLSLATDWLLSRSKAWQYEQIEEFDKNRAEPLKYYAAMFGHTRVAPSKTRYDLTPVFSSHYFIPPYWSLGLKHPDHYELS